MKLSKEKIQYIDTYLKQSGVTYWDVRAELLDHFVMGIEQKMTEKQLSFEEALNEITIAFGNTARKKYVLNTDNTQWIPSGTFSEGEAFKKLQREKQRQIGKKNFKAYWKELSTLFFSLNFYVAFILMILLIFTISKYSEKWALIAGILYVFSPFILIIYTSIKGEIPKKSLHINMAMIGVFLWINVFSLVPNIYRSFYDEKMEFQIFAWMLILLFPFIKASFVRYNNVCKEAKKYYDLIAK